VQAYDGLDAPARWAAALAFTMRAEPAAIDVFVLALRAMSGVFGDEAILDGLA